MLLQIKFPLIQTFTKFETNEIYSNEVNLWGVVGYE